MNKNYTAIIAAFLMGAILIVFLGSFTLVKTDFSLAEESEKVIYLTFDDGPTDRTTPKILDILKSEDVRATFFVIGRNAAARKSILKREYDEGHAIGVHSYSHRYSEIYASPEGLLKDIDDCNAVIAEVTGKPTSLYRFPGGSYGLSEKLISAVTAHGMRYIDWNASFCDSEIPNATAEQLVTCAKTTIAYPQKVIMLAHDATDKSATVDALPTVIRHFKDKGYVFKAFK